MQTTFIKSLHDPLPLKPGEDDDGDDHHDTQGDEIAILPTQLRHVVKVHPIDPGDESQGEEEGRKNGQQLHGIIATLGRD